MDDSWGWSFWHRHGNRRYDLKDAATNWMGDYDSSGVWMGEVGVAMRERRHTHTDWER